MSAPFLSARLFFAVGLLGLALARPGPRRRRPPLDRAAATARPSASWPPCASAQPIKLDGVLDEAAWREALPATDFIQNRPKPGPHEKHPTEVRVLYDDAAIYVGAMMHDVSPDSIPRELTARDNSGNSDFIGIFLDTYHDQLNGYALHRDQQRRAD